MTKDEQKKFINQTLTYLKNQRQRYESEWREASNLLAHRTNEPASGLTKGKECRNPAPRDALNTCKHGIAGYLISPSIRWFKYAVRGNNFEKSDSLEGANDWLEYVTTLQYSLFANSKFYAVSGDTALEDALVTGTSYEMVLDDVDHNQIVFTAYNPYECYIAENGQGEVDTFFREFTMTTRDAVKKFGDKLPSEIRNTADENPYAESSFVQAIFPREDYIEGSTEATSKKFASLYYSKTGDEVFYESGFDEFPLAIHRWKRTDGSAYGVGLCVEYLPLIKRLNFLTNQYNIAVEYQVNPALRAPLSLQNKFKYRAGAVNFADPTDGEVKPIQIQFNIQYLQAQIQELEIQIQRMFYADLFNVLMRQDRQRTAYEVSELKGEGLILLSAIIGNMQNEKLNPLVNRTRSIMKRAGLIPEPPMSLKQASDEGRVELELDGPLAQTMKQYHQATGLEQGLGAVASIAQLFPNTLVNFDSNEIARQYATSKGLPQSCIREISERDKIEQQMAQQQQQEAQQQQAIAQSQVLKNLGYNAQSTTALNQVGQTGEAVYQ